MGMACLERARDLAAAAGRSQAVAFVQQLFDGAKNGAGKRTACTHKSSCSDKAVAEDPCSDHDAIARRVADALKSQDSDSPSAASNDAARRQDFEFSLNWSDSDMDERLILLVAKEGPGDGAAKAATLDMDVHPETGKSVAEEVALRWEYLRPMVVEEFMTREGVQGAAGPHLRNLSK